MIRASKTAALFASTALALTLTAAEVYAGGFAIREQSTYFQGTQFAGAAAGGPSASSMFWNPATMTQHGAWLTKEMAATAIIADSKINPSSATAAGFPAGALQGLGGSGNVSGNAVVPAGYTIYRPNDRWALGVYTGAPFGLATRPNYAWAGQFYGRDSEVFSFNVTPMVAVQLDSWISVGVGVQIQYFYVELDQAFPGTAGANFKLQGDGVSAGFTAGVTLTPLPWTTIGIGYRSGIDQKVEGQISRPAVGPLGNFSTSVSANIPLPQSVNIGIRQKVTEQLTLMGTYEWTDWSRFGTVPLRYSPAGLALPPALPFEWEDGWFLSFGAEYQWSPTWAVRAGIGIEHSPVNDRVRGVRLADNDRVWVGAGLTYNWSHKLALEIGYSHIFVEDAPINITAGNPLFTPGFTFTGTGETSIDIISVGFRYKFGDPPVKPVITKG